MVVVSSITHAMSGQRLLADFGIRSMVDRDVNTYGRYGCGYILRIADNCERAVAILERSRINIKEIIYGDRG